MLPRPRRRGPGVAGLGANCAARRCDGRFGAAELEAVPVGAEGERLDEVRAGLEVLAMDGRDEVRTRGGELVQAGSLRDAPGEQQGAHAAVGQQGTFGKAGGETGARQAHLGAKGSGSARR